MFPSTVSATLILTALISNTAYGGTMQITVPDLDAHVSMFVELPIGMTQRAFRLKVPSAWRPAASMNSVSQNTNPRGEIDTGAFDYEFEARATFDPQSRFEFWQGKLVYAVLYSTTWQVAESDGFLKAADRAGALLVQRFGKPKSTEADDNHRLIKWERDGIAVSLSANRKDPNAQAQPGDFDLAMQDIASHALYAKWANRQPPNPKGTRPLVDLFCTTTVASGGMLEFALTTDTRKLRKDAAERYAAIRKTAMESRGARCETMVTTDSESERQFNRMSSGKHILATYLRYVDGDGMRGVISFLSGDTEHEDAICESFLQGLLKTAKSGECVTGWAVWQHPD
jgi:hypothetical protein